MKNIIVLGSGRSGTSMVTGTLAQAGYYMGDHFWEPRDSNPKGFFETDEINTINEDILDPFVPPRLNLFGKTFFRNRPRKRDRWLAYIPLSVNLKSSPNIDQQIQQMTQSQPYCFKDPRFSYTLPVWKPYLQNEVYICVFRDPASTASSILKECQQTPKLRDPKKGVKISWKQALKIWNSMYSHILQNYYNSEEQHKWLFIHYNQAVTEQGLKTLEEFTGAAVDYSFPEAAIRRSFSSKAVSKSAIQIYQKLCQLAKYQENFK